MEQLRCSRCGLPVSTSVPDDTIVRGWIECPECIEEHERKEPGQQYPPAGMPIQVFCRRPHGGNYGENSRPEWRMAVSRGGGYYTYTASDDARLKPLENREWRYLPAPDAWPDGACQWAATNQGEYLWLTAVFEVGQQVGPCGAKIVHVEDRPEGK